MSGVIEVAGVAPKSVEDAVVGMHHRVVEAVSRRGARATMTDGAGADGGLSARAVDAGVVPGVFGQMPLTLAAVERPELRIMAATGGYRASMGRPNVVGPSARKAFPEAIGQQRFQVFERVHATGEPESQREFRLQMPVRLS